MLTLHWLQALVRLFGRNLFMSWLLFELFYRALRFVASLAVRILIEGIFLFFLHLLLPDRILVLYFLLHEFGLLGKTVSLNSMIASVIITSLLLT
jgi:hypothetical protein